MPHDNPAAVPLRRAEPGDLAAIMRMCEDFRLIMAASAHEFQHPEDAINMAMVAEMTFAGVQAGSLIALGDLTDTAEQRADLQRVIDVNFNLGIVLGKAHVARISDPVVIPFGGTAH